MPDENNLDLWDAVCKTDPRHTKKVSFGRKFTAIDAYYQFHMATREFGPAGDGWGWHTPEFSMLGEGENTLLVCHVELWYQRGQSPSVLPLVAATKLYSKSGDNLRIDEDAHKKVLTNALTKGLSYLGFSADVFLGKFDDNQYVQQMRGEAMAAENGGEPEGERTSESEPTRLTTDQPEERHELYKALTPLMKEHKITPEQLRDTLGKPAEECTVKELRALVDKLSGEGAEPSAPKPDKDTIEALRGEALDLLIRAKKDGEFQNEYFDEREGLTAEQWAEEVDKLRPKNKRGQGKLEGVA